MRQVQVFQYVQGLRNYPGREQPWQIGSYVPLSLPALFKRLFLDRRWLQADGLALSAACFRIVLLCLCRASHALLNLHRLINVHVLHYGDARWADDLRNNGNSSAGFFLGLFTISVVQRTYPSFPPAWFSARTMSRIGRTLTTSLHSSPSSLQCSRLNAQSRSPNTCSSTRKSFA